MKDRQAEENKKSADYRQKQVQKIHDSILTKASQIDEAQREERVKERCRDGRKSNDLHV